MEERYRALAEETASQAAANKGLELELETARKANFSPLSGFHWFQWTDQMTCLGL